jgi:hypothetical protein
MTDIFLSYNEKDREQARRVAAMLEAVGWSVWWDRRIPAGETWRSVLEKALDNMRCMIVLWSSHSIESEWVYEEATEGRRLGKLIPVLIEAVRPPAGFREIQAADLTDWDGSREFDGMRMLIADLENFLGKPARSANAAPPKKPVDQNPPYDPADLAGGRTTTTWWQRHQRPAVVAAGLLLAAGAAYLTLSSRPPAVVAPQVRDPAQQEIAVKPPSAETTPAPTAPAQSAPELASPAPPAPVAPETTTPVARLPPKTARTPLKPAETARATGTRCADLLYKIQLGESLSYGEQSVFRKECQQ